LGAHSNPDPRANRFEQRIWQVVSHSPLESLWSLQGVPARELARRTWNSLIQDRVFGHAAELGFYFLFSLFPTLFCAGAVIGLAARSAHDVYLHILRNLSLVIPTSALGTVLTTFNQTTAAASSSKVTLSSIAAVWSASVGVSAIQDTLNQVYKIDESRSYVAARIYAIGLTILLTVIVSLGLASMFGGDLAASLAYQTISRHNLAMAAAIGARVVAWIIATALLALAFAVVYYWAPDWKKRRWRWFTPGGAVGIVLWLAASLGFRVYLHFFNNYAVTYGSLGAVIILLMWFYITGLMVLLGGEINSQIEAAAVNNRLAANEIATEEPSPAA
jgi:membrane protein